MEYRVLTLYEPWATLVVNDGIKKIETRPSPTTWTAEKGTYLIHAGKRLTRQQRELCIQEPFLSEFKKFHKVWINEQIGGRPLFRLGCIIGSVEIIDCCKIWHGSVIPNNELSRNILLPENFRALRIGLIISDNDKKLGNFNHGRYAWICSNPRILKNPIPYKNGQGYYQKFKGDTKQLIFK